MTSISRALEYGREEIAMPFDHDAASDAAAREARLRTRRRAKMAMLNARFAGMIDERIRLARELHDTLLHAMTAIALEAEAALPSVRTSPERALRTLERILELAEQSGRDTRQAVWDIRRSVLTDGEFVRAVEATAQQLVAESAIVLQTHVAGRISRMSPERQTVILRIVHEAVTNAVRHSAATHVFVQLTNGRKNTSVSVTDDGVGFVVDSDLDVRPGHWGLVGMRERAETAGARVAIRSSPGEGTTVQLVLPHAGSSIIERRSRWQ